LNNSPIYVQLNGNSSGVYKSAGVKLDWASTYASSNYNGFDSTGGDDRIQIGKMSNTGGSRADGYVMLNGCNSAGVKAFQVAGSGRADGSNTQTSYFHGGVFDDSATISSITVGTSGGGNLDNGTVFVYTSVI
jgi:hypothetical protein